MTHEEEHLIHKIGESVGEPGGIRLAVDYAPGTVVTNVNNIESPPANPIDTEVQFATDTNPGYLSPGDWRKTKLVPNSNVGFNNSGWVIKHTDKRNNRHSSEPNSWQGSIPLFAAVTPTNKKYPIDKKNWFLRFSITRNTNRTPGTFFINTTGADYNAPDPGGRNPDKLYYAHSGAYNTCYDKMPIPEYNGMYGKGKVRHDFTHWRIVDFGRPYWHVSDDIRYTKGTVIHQGTIDPLTGVLDIPDYYLYDYRVGTFDKFPPSPWPGNFYSIPIGQAWYSWLELQISFEGYIYPHPPEGTPSMWPVPLGERNTDTFSWTFRDEAGNPIQTRAENNIPPRYNWQAADPDIYWRDYHTPIVDRPPNRDIVRTDVGP